VPILYRADGRPRLVVPGVVVMVATFLVAWGAGTVATRPRTDEERAEALSRSKSFGRAEEIYVGLLRGAPTVPRLLDFVANHRRGLADDARRRVEGGRPRDPAHPMMSDDAVAALYDRLPAEIALVARFVAVRSPAPDVEDAITSGAAREPPVAWFNELLGDAAERRRATAEAARYFLREGLAFPERGGDVDRAIELWMDDDDWDEARARLADPRVAAATGPGTRARLAVHDRDGLAAVRWYLRGWHDRLTVTGLAMSGVAALAWGFFCARLGKLGQRPGRRLAFYLAAFVLGVLSVFPTVALIAVEEAKLRLVETGDAVRDVLYFVFGVGLREEASKLALFALLLPFLRRWGDKLDVLIAGAMVGLGFAAEENLGYLAGGDIQTELGRFLTANFMHIAMTGILAAALDDFVSDPAERSTAFSNTALTVVGLHGAYDFLLSHQELGGGYLAMVAFVILTRMFLGAANRARQRGERGLTPLHAFVLATAVVTGVGAAYATLAVGPLAAAAAMGEGLLGEAMTVFVFVTTIGAVQ
jgi:RsiW-degrading membrane proteinase PrsW (M82 family)